MQLEAFEDEPKIVIPCCKSLSKYYHADIWNFHALFSKHYVSFNASLQTTKTAFFGNITAYQNYQKMSKKVESI